jgi:hypothetical protein
MHAQIAYFDGPRSADLVAAGDRAGRERIEPAIYADPQLRAAHVATFVLRQPDGGEAVVIIADSEDTLDRGVEVIQNTELLPGEDETLLPGPDRVERYAVVYAAEHGTPLQDVAS